MGAGCVTAEHVALAYVVGFAVMATVLDGAPRLPDRHQPAGNPAAAGVAHDDGRCCGARLLPPLVVLAVVAAYVPPSSNASPQPASPRTWPPPSTPRQPHAGRPGGHLFLCLYGHADSDRRPGRYPWGRGASCCWRPGGGAGSVVSPLAPTLEIALIGPHPGGPRGFQCTSSPQLKIIALNFEESRFATWWGGAAGGIWDRCWPAPLFPPSPRPPAGAGVFCRVGRCPSPSASPAGFCARSRAGRRWGRPRLRPYRRPRSALRGAQESGHPPAALVPTGVCGSFFTFGGLWAMPHLTQVHGLTRAQASASLSVYFLCFALGALFIGTLPTASGDASRR